MHLAEIKAALLPMPQFLSLPINERCRGLPTGHPLHYRVLHKPTQRLPATLEYLHQPLIHALIQRDLVANPWFFAMPHSFAPSPQEASASASTTITQIIQSISFFSKNQEHRSRCTFLVLIALIALG